MTLKSPCDNCFVLPVCINKNHIDILLDCDVVTRYVISHKNKTDKVTRVLFPIKQLQDKFNIVINEVPNRQVLVVSLYEVKNKAGIDNDDSFVWNLKENKPRIDYETFVWYINGGRQGKGASQLII